MSRHLGLKHHRTRPRPRAMVTREPGQAALRRLGTRPFFLQDKFRASSNLDGFQSTLLSKFTVCQVI